MGLLDTLLSGQNSSALTKIAGEFGLGESQTRDAVTKLLPALSQGIQKNMSSPDGLSGLMGALSKGHHQQYLDNPETLRKKETITDGNAILGHLLGSKEASRQVANHAAQETGVDSGILKKMLPMVAAMAMGGLSKQAGASGLSSGLSGNQGSSGMVGMLSSFLDADKDGSIVDDLAGMAKKFL